MSADNWAKCPGCSVKKPEYGKVSEETYAKYIKEKNNKEATLREDYEIYNDDDGLVSISYCCSCDECGFEYSFNKEINLIKKLKEQQNEKTH